MAVSHIMLEAYKKYILVALMLHGKVFVLITGRNERCGQGNIFTPVCHSVHREGGLQ